ncbi:MAG: integrase family protein, partial [Firmicutes bacterium]|nr:integrase family protein [Bacillota bacterium]
REVTDLKKEKARVEASGTIFTKMGGLKMAERLYESSMVKLSDFAASMAETFKLIERVKQLPDVPGDGMALAVVGDSMTMHALLEETDSELLQLSGICGDVELYPDLSPGTAVYRRSQIYDAALKREGMPPFFMQLTEDEQLTFGNAFIKKLAETANPSCPLLGIREVISTMDAGNSIEELLGVRLPDLLPSTPYEAANIAKLKIPKGRPYAQD